MSEVVVVGGGLAGGAAAALLASAGRRVRLLEREREPRDKICGEFLSVEAQRHLTALGLDLARLGGAPIDRMRLAWRDRTVEAALPFTAMGLTRRRLDEALLEHAAALGAEVERGVAVRSVSTEGVESSQGRLSPRTVLLATGKHELRGLRRERAGAEDGFVGFKSYFRVAAPVRAELDGYIEVVLFDGGYAGLQLVEGGVANLCLLATQARFAASGRTWEALLATLMAEPHLARRLGDAAPLLDRPLTIAGVPYGFVHRPGDEDAELYRLGDQAAVIPSFSGDGMSIALHSARLAARAVAEDAGAQRYHTRLRRDVSRQIALAMRLQRLGSGPIGRRAIMAAGALAPALLPALAAWTRVSPGALARAGL